MNQEQVLSLLSKNVNEHTEKKGGLTYLSWAWGWGNSRSPRFLAAPGERPPASRGIAVVERCLAQQ